MDADHVGKLAKVIKQLVLIRDVWFDVAAVRCDRNEPVLAVMLQKIHIPKHRSRIFGTEADDINDGRIKSVPADLIWVIGITDTDNPFY